MKLSQAEFKILSSRIENVLGIFFDSSKKNDLERQMKTAYRESGFDSEDQFKEYLLKGDFDKDKIYLLSQFLTVGETYFFRENKVLEILRFKLIPEKLEEEEEKIVFWSASCSTGEEPYSLAIILKEYFPSVFERCLIYATDINSVFLKKAKEGIYRNWSFRNSPEYYRKTYFIDRGEGYFEIKPFIKEKVRFGFLNLMDGSYPFPYNREEYFDFVFFRNTMIYFSVDSIKNVLTKIYRSLREKGYLITGLVETSLVNYNKFKPLVYEGIKYFQKDPGYTGEKVKESKYYSGSPGESKKIEVAKRKYERIKRTKFIVRDNLEVAKKEKIISSDSIFELFGKGEYTEVINLIEKIRSTDSYKELKSELKEKLNFIYCNSLTNIGDINTAIRKCRKILAENKLDYKLHRLLSQLLLEIGDYPAALDHLNKAIFIKPDSPFLHFLRATVNTKMNNTEEARKDYNVTIEMLNKVEPESILEEADGLNAARIKDIALSMIKHLN